MGEEISIRTIQHYLYCPHRWGLLEIDRAWAENMFVTKANLLHGRVHDPDSHYTTGSKKVFTSVPVYHDDPKYNLYGIVDCLELIEDKSGVSIDNMSGKYRICIVEYKPTKPKDKEYYEEDLMQVFAQKLCVDYVFGGDCEAVLYYADVKKRVRLPLKENFTAYEETLTDILEDMRDRLETGKIPKIRVGQKCSGCSMADMCLPRAGDRVNFLAALRQAGQSEEISEQEPPLWQNGCR